MAISIQAVLLFIKTDLARMTVPAPRDSENIPLPDVSKASMPRRRHANRIVAMQYLYLWDVVRPENLAESVRLFLKAHAAELPEDHLSFARELVHGVVEHIDEIDEAIRTYAQNWSFSRISKVDLAILRAATYEITRRNDIPPVVTINEAIELSKEFSAAESKRFINGVLDRLREATGRPSREAIK
jgi:N utilization substance protein B